RVDLSTSSPGRSANAARVSKTFGLSSTARPSGPVKSRCALSSRKPANSSSFEPSAVISPPPPAGFRWIQNASGGDQKPIQPLRRNRIPATHNKKASQSIPAAALPAKLEETTMMRCKSLLALGLSATILAAPSAFADQPRQPFGHEEVTVEFRYKSWESAKDNYR